MTPILKRGKFHSSGMATIQVKKVYFSLQLTNIVVFTQKKDFFSSLVCFLSINMKYIQWNTFVVHFCSHFRYISKDKGNKLLTIKKLFLRFLVVGNFLFSCSVYSTSESYGIYLLYNHNILCYNFPFIKFSNTDCSFRADNCEGPNKSISQLLLRSYPELVSGLMLK